MKDWLKAVRTSRVLDAKTRSDQVPEAQARIHDVLSSGDALPDFEPSPGLRARIEQAIDEANHSPIPLELPWLRPAPWGSIAAALALLAGTAGIVAVARHPDVVAGWFAGHRPARIIAAAPAPAQPLAVSIDPGVNDAETHAVAAASASPITREVELMKKDAERAIGSVFTHLPVFDAK